jgi:hypothetical protein
MTGQRPYVTIRQGSTQLTLTDDRLAVTVDESGSAIAFSLTQQETLRFKVGAADVQVKTIDEGGSVKATGKAKLGIEEALLERVITYADDTP